MDGYCTGWREIGEVFGTTSKRVRAWRQAGAPILLLGKQPVTRLDDLWYWLLDHKKEVGDGPDLGGRDAARLGKGG